MRDAFVSQGGDVITKRFADATVNDFWQGVNLKKPLLHRDALLASKGDKVSLQLGGDQPFEGELTGRLSRKDGAQVFGMKIPGSGFQLQYIEFTDGRIIGGIRQAKHPVSYRLSGTVQEPVITAIAAVEDYCSKWSDEEKGIVQGLPPADRATPSQVPVTTVARLDSNIDSENVIYLDFDGEDITGLGSGWGDINAGASFFTATQIEQIWNSVSEDFRVFDVNVTTDRAVFDATPIGQRMMVIFTPDDDAAPGAGGVAFLGSFYDGSDEPCWVFNGGVGSAALAASHEVGHTLDLLHDGRIAPAEEYYFGSPTWGPIMGAPYNSLVSHWSKGEYVSANNQEDDIAIIAATLPIFDDTVGDDTFSAEVLATDEDGNFTLTGLVETQSDRDVYSFDTSGGLVTINAAAGGPEGGINGQNLNIRLSIVDAGGGLIVESNDTSGLSTSISANIVGGSYFLIIEGDGESTWAAGGYGDYSSIGEFSVTGNLPPPTPGDFDGDGLSDDEELALGTDPYDRDTDGDGLSDRQEVYPFSIVSGQYTYDAALVDALNSGGNLTVIDSPQKLYRVKRGLLTTALPSPIPANYDPLVDVLQRLWLGGSDSSTDGLFQWVTPVGDLNGAEIGSAFLANVEPGSSTLTNVVNVNSLTVGRRLQGSGLPGPVTITAIDTAARTVTLSSPVNAALNQGVASVIIQNPGTGFTTPPTISFNPPGATATATVALGRITSITVNNPGTYTVPPTVTIRGSSGAGASALAVLTPSSTLARVISIEVTNGGTGYTAPPEVVINGVGQGALAEANIDDTTGVVTGITLLNSGLGYTTAPTITLVGGGGNNATAIAKIADPAMRVYSPATPNTYSRWSGGLLPGNRLNVAEGVALNSGTEFLWSATQVTSGLGYLLERPVTNPRAADTDGDGIADLLEFQEYGTNPSLADSDGDGVSDPDELFVHKSNPKLVDTDGDGLTDGQEVNGLVGGFKSNPLVIDSDGDGVSDVVEVNSVPPTNPLDATSFPYGATATPDNGLQNTVVASGQSSVSVDLTYAPFGHRPDTDKSGDDGSVAIRDRNGAILWVDNTGRSAVIQNSSLARTLYVSNTECVLYNNRYDGTYDARESTSTVVIHRRGLDGNIVTSQPIVIPGTVVDTAPISPTTYGFTLVAGVSFDDNFQESTERYQSGTTQQGNPIFDIRSLNYWDVCNYTMYRITWDAQVQTLGGTQLDVVPGAPNLGSTRVIATGSDGSFVFNRVVAQNFYRDLPNGGYFNSETASYWTSFNLNSENIGRVSLRFQPEVENVGYLSNTRALLEFPIVIQEGFDANLNPFYVETGNYELQDMRQRKNGVTNTVNTFPLDLGDKLLPVTPYTRSGLIPYVYTISALRSSVKFYRVDATLAQLGPVVNLPDPVLDDTAAIRNAWDGSLLMKSEGQSGLLWLPTTISPITQRVEGLGNARSLPGSTSAAPMFVDSLQAVAWMNSDAPVDLSAGAQVPLAQINHFRRGSGNGVVLTPLTPPIQGRYVALPPLITPEANLEGWFVTTFEKTGDRSSTIRTYRLGLGSATDRDNDGLPDSVELSIGTDPNSADTDKDGLSDGDELAPYYAVNGQFSWTEANADALLRGGKLGVFRNRDDYISAYSRFKGILVNNLWIGASDSLFESEWKWVDGTNLNTATWLNPPVSLWESFKTVFGKNSVPWLIGRPNNAGNADYLILNTSFQFEDRPEEQKLGYLIEYPRTNPITADSDGDGMSDGDEILAGSNPAVSSPFAGVPTPPLSAPAEPFVNFASSGVAGDYEGLVFNPEEGHTHRIVVKLNSRGAFSASLAGLESFIRGSFRGQMNPAGYYLGAVPGNLSGMTSVELWLVEDGPGRWIIRGRSRTNTAVNLGIELRRSAYGKSNRYATPGRVTTMMPLADAQNPGPKGDVVATGSVSANGVVSLAMYTPDGGRASFSGSILYGDLVSLRALSTKKGTGSALLGTLKMNEILIDRDFGGSLRYYSPRAVLGSLYQNGFSQTRYVSGSRYVAPPKGLVALTGFTTTQYNSLFNMSGGEFAGVSKIGTWSVGNKISIPASPSDIASASFNASTGLLTYSQTLSNATLGLVNAKATAFAIHQQKASEVRGSAVLRGHYVSQFSNGMFFVSPNDGTIPELTMISPVIQNALRPAQVYTIDVRTQGAWNVVIPANTPWVTAEVVTGAVADTASLLDGTGNGTVRITLLENTGYYAREITISVAGVPHTIRQDYRAQ